MGNIQTSEGTGEEASTQPKIKRSRHNTRRITRETSLEVVTEIVQKAYKGEKIGPTVRKDHKFDPKQRVFAGRAL